MLLTDAQGIGNNASYSFLDHAPDLLNQNLCGLCQGICISKSPLGMCEHLNCIFHPTPISVISLFYLIIDKMESAIFHLFSINVLSLSGGNLSVISCQGNGVFCMWSAGLFCSQTEGVDLKKVEGDGIGMSSLHTPSIPTPDPVLGPWMGRWGAS